MKYVTWIALILTLIGGINWGLVGLLGMDLVVMIGGVGTTLTKVVYIVIGVSALYTAYNLRGMLKP